MFESFRRSLTGGYVFLALVLILLVVAASSALSFLLYSRQLNENVNEAAQRASTEASQFASSHTPIAQAADAIVHSIGRERFHVVVYDSSHKILAANEHPEKPTPGRRIAMTIGAMIGLPRVRVPMNGGTIVISADYDRFGNTLVWYWSIILPIGGAAVFAAWLFGRRITARAVGPLIDVTQSLRQIAGGDLAPQNLLHDSGSLRELTTAYNDVVLRLSAATAERNQTEAQMRQFIADAGHELRTPLTVIMGYLDLLRAGGVADGSAAERVYETMLDESRRMRALIERLILLARLDRTPSAQNLVPTDLSTLVRRAIDSVSAARGDSRITLQDEAAAPIAEVDEADVYEAIKNVIDNAMKYAPGSPVEVRLTEQDRSVCICVSDKGPGMEPQEVEHAFDRFYRGGQKYDVEGSGLGLAIAKRAVERASGTIDLQSEPGAGTRVTLCFPSIVRNLADYESTVST
jgi:signal transduction histidine kinase